MPKRTLIVLRTIPHYRAPFFELLRGHLSEAGVQLGLVYGQPEPEESSKQDSVRVEWAVERRTVFIPAGGRSLLWQACLAPALRADLVVVEQASRLLVNYPLVALQSLGGPRVAFWGHGRTPKAVPSSRLGEAAKGFMSRRVHWFFAYNEVGADLVRGLGVDPGRITVVQNAIDTSSLVAAARDLNDAQLGAERARLGLTGENVCLFVGAMYREKRLPFLIASCELIRQRVPDFEMLFVGDGPEAHVVLDATRRNPWMKHLGPVNDARRAIFYRLAKLVLMPGRVGLGILDALALETPLVTTAVPYHAPEIGYLEDGVNGVVVAEPDSPHVYAGCVEALLADATWRERLRTGCRRTSGQYGIEQMARNFADGVLAALEAPGPGLPTG